MNNVYLMVNDIYNQRFCVTIVGTFNAVGGSVRWMTYYVANDVMKIMITVHILPGISDQSEEPSFM